MLFSYFVLFETKLDSTNANENFNTTINTQEKLFKRVDFFKFTLLFWIICLMFEKLKCCFLKFTKLKHVFLNCKWATVFQMPILLDSLAFILYIFALIYDSK
jgi:hypothetical protein